MNVNIQIHYITSSKAYQKGDFHLRGRKPEQVALEFWKQIKKDMSYNAELEKVIVDGNIDITQLVKELEGKERKKIDNFVDDYLPF
ncbi:hypothetical protein P5G62_015350 [Neobacillus sp. 179-C4.2 HS]|uniref:Uncharacterized protein n=1 Tax=Neobacillus driksii TaxID=3035913 RepID=A0ABV4YUV4_9BACI|nr:hypothetical protein [Neobacillus sp. 179.-C4.2 HS]MDP5192739.1 hypothetical protein [Neobacillus sp. 179.-C4.2 HS]